jgi:hypothetical protein
MFCRTDPSLSFYLLVTLLALVAMYHICIKPQDTRRETYMQKKQFKMREERMGFRG